MKLIKKAIAPIIIFTAIIASNILPVYAADVPDVPVLTSISFSNAEIDGKFSPETYSYYLNLDDSGVAPAIASYKPENLKVTAVYNYDETHHPTGITVTVSNYDSIQYSTYFFNYSNLDKYEINGNNLIRSISCENCELSPAINNEDTEYTLYIPSDMTEIKLSVVAQDINAYCSYGGTITCAQGQELSVPITVTASDGSQKQYKVNIVRLNKTISQVKEEMSKSDFKSLVDGEKFYQKNSFKVAIASSIGGIILIAILVAVTKRITVKISDNDELEFFEIENSQISNN